MSTTTNLLTGGQVVSRVLKAHGINTAFSLAGVAHAQVLYALHDDGFNIVSSRNETATVAAADGYARVSGKVGVAMIVGYQGMPNVLGGIRTAQLACSPVVLLVGLTAAQVAESGDEETNDGLDMIKPFVKWAKAVPAADRIEEYLNAAIRAATSGRPGVAVLGISQSQEAAQVDPSKVTAVAPTLARRAEASSEGIADAAALLAKAERPLILAGSGAALSGAGAPLQALAKDFGIPVFGHALGRGLVSEDMALGFPWAFAQVAAKEADVVVVAGMRLTQRIGFGMPPRFSKDAKFIQIDIAAEELGRNRPVDIGLAGDAAASLTKLHHALTAAKAPKKSSTWVNAATAGRKERISELSAAKATGPLHPLRIGAELKDLMPEDAILVVDGADIYNWMSSILRVHRPRSYMDHYPLGSMGVGTPLALGAAAAVREDSQKTGKPLRTVVLITGDGSFGFYPAELNSFVLAGLKVICIVANDGAWGTEKNAQLNSRGMTVNCELGFCDYHLMGDVFGCRGEKVVREEELRPALQRAFAADQSTVLNVITDPDAGIERKKDPRLQMVTFEDLQVSLKARHAPSVA